MAVHSRVAVIAACCFFAVTGSFLERPLKDRPSKARLNAVRKQVQSVLDTANQVYNISVQFGFVDSAGSLALASGVSNAWTGEPLLGTTKIPLGSAVKPWTAVQIMQAVEAGKVSLDDTASKWIDPLLVKEGGRSLEQMLGEYARTITIRNLLTHSSGIPDYDDATLKIRAQWSGADILPLEYFDALSEDEFEDDPIRCAAAPGGCVHYSGLNYILLGYVLTALQGKQAWDQLDQMAVIPAKLRSPNRYANTAFAMRGPCSQYSDVSHTYDVENVDGVMYVDDMTSKSCLNGFTMGNILTTAKDMATFFYDLFDLKLVKQETLDIMTQFHPMPDTWCHGLGGYGKCDYGMGLNNEVIDGTKGEGQVFEHSRMIGHGGANWGTTTGSCAYNPEYKFGICISFASSGALSSRLGEAITEWGPPNTACSVYDAVMAAIGGPRLQCKAWPVPGPERSVSWTTDLCETMRSQSNTPEGYADAFEEFCSATTSSTTTTATLAATPATGTTTTMVPTRKVVMRHGKVGVKGKKVVKGSTTPTTPATTVSPQKIVARRAKVGVKGKTVATIVRRRAAPSSALLKKRVPAKDDSTAVHRKKRVATNAAL